MIEVRLFANFRENRDKILFLDEDHYINPQKILDELGIKKEDVAILLVNGRHNTVDCPLKDQDIVALFPPVAGG